MTSLDRLKFSKQVRAFTEHGALMAAMVLSSPRAVAMSVYVVRAFILEPKNKKHKSIGS